MESNGKRESFNLQNEEEYFKRFKREHDVAMGYVPRNVETATNQDVPIWEQLQQAFPMPAWLKDRIEIGGIYYEVERPKYDCFKPVSFNCVCYKCITANCTGMAYLKRTYVPSIESHDVVDFSCACPTCSACNLEQFTYLHGIMQEREDEEFNVLPSPAKETYNVRALYEEEENERIITVISAAHFYCADDTFDVSTQNTPGTPAFSRVCFREQDSPIPLGRYWARTRSIIPTKLRF